MDKIVISLWRPSDKLPKGHSAMKVSKNGVDSCCSWWPSEGGRATPPTYGPKGTPREPKADAPNKPRQAVDMKQQRMSGPQLAPKPIKSDREMLASEKKPPKHATLKFQFHDGLNVDAAIAKWEELLASDQKYNGQSYNCHMPVAEARAAAGSGNTTPLPFNGHGVWGDPGLRKLVQQKDATLRPLKKRNDGAWGATEMGQLCLELGKKIDSEDLSEKSRVIVRHKRYDEAKGSVDKLDCASAGVKIAADSRTGKMTTSFHAAAGKVNLRSSEAEYAEERKPDVECFAPPSAAVSGESGASALGSATTVMNSSNE